MAAAPQPVLERASTTDRAFLAMDTGGVPEQFAVVLMLRRAGELEPSQVRRLIGARICAVPRLRQRLVRAPFGCGGPVWRDDPGFDLSLHVTSTRCPEPGDRRALLDRATTVVLTRLPRTAPLWRATLITGLADGDAALVVVLHHVLADGVGGLAVLAALLDPGAPPAASAFPRPGAGRVALAKDAWTSRLGAVRGAPRSWRRLHRSMSAAGGLRPSPATPCSLLARTGPHRVVAAVTVERTRLRAAAHRHGATTNDAVLVAVAAALAQVLQGRGESVASLVVTVPVSGRGGDQAERDGPALGNMVSPMLVEVPTGGPVGERLQRVGAAVRAGKASATGPPPIALLGWAFRPLARLGAFRLYMTHQRRFHTLVSHVRGPDRPVWFAGHEVVEAVPIGIGEGGNVTVHVEVLSYADRITVAAVLDPDHFPEVDALAGHLEQQFVAVAAG